MSSAFSGNALRGWASYPSQIHYPASTISCKGVLMFVFKKKSSKWALKLADPDICWDNHNDSPDKLQQRAIDHRICEAVHG